MTQQIFFFTDEEIEEIWPEVGCYNEGVLALQHLIHPISSAT